MKWLYKAINWNVHELFMSSYLFLPKDTKYKSKEQSVNLCLNILFHNRELSASSFVSKRRFKRPFEALYHEQALKQIIFKIQQ